MHLKHCRACIEIYSTSAYTLERRICQAKGKTLRYKSSANKKKVVQGEDGQASQTPLSATQETMMKFPEYFHDPKATDEMKEDKKEDEKKDEMNEEKKDEKKDERKDEKIEEKNHEKKDEKGDEKKDERKDEKMHAKKAEKANEETEYFSSSEEEEFDSSKLDDLVAAASNLSPTQETILKYPQFFNAGDGSTKR